MRPTSSPEAIASVTLSTATMPPKLLRRSLSASSPGALTPAAPHRSPQLHSRSRQPLRIRRRPLRDEPGPATTTRDGAHEALAEETADEDHQRREHQQVAHADLAQRLGGHFHEHRAHERAGDGPHAADDHHADDEAGLEDEPELGAGQLQEMHEERAGDAAAGARDGEGEGLVADDVHAAR